MSFSCTHAIRSGSFARYSLLFLFLLETICCTSLRAQKKYPAGNANQLLWRIDKPGLPQPSYLYGTMHLRDQRVFNFSDSVLPAFHQAKIFAMELDMDSLMSYLFNPEGPVRDTTNYMRSMLDHSQYTFTDSLVKVKTGLHISQLQSKRLWVIEKLLIDQEEELAQTTSGKQAREHIFLDAWFHQKAAGLNKRLAGLEKLENQTGFFAGKVPDLEKEMFLEEIGYYAQLDGPVKEWAVSRSASRGHYLDSLVKIYYRGDLEAMENLINSKPEESNDLLSLDKRNRDMTTNLIRLTAEGSVFAAVGAAHLPGQHGIVALLRKQGFTVTPVTPTFTGLAATYKQQYNKLKGYTLNRIGEGYSVTLPGMPIAYPLPGSNTSMYMSADEAAGEMAFAYAVSTGQMVVEPAKLKLMMLESIAGNFGTKPNSIHNISYRGNDGAEADITAQNIRYRVRVFIRNSKAYLFMHNISPDADSLSAKSFFNSVRIADVAAPATLYDTLRNQTNGIQLLFPSVYQLFNAGNQSAHAASGRYAESYSAIDRTQQISVSMQIMKTSPGYYNTDDRRLVSQFKENAYHQDSLLQLTDSVTYLHEGFPAVDIKIRYSNGYNGWLRMIYRANLSYILLCQYRPAGEKQVQEIMKSVHLLPLSSTPPTLDFTTEDSTVTVSGPGPFAIRQNLLPANRHTSQTGLYQAADSSMQASYLVYEQANQPYFSADPDSICKNMIPPFTDSTREPVFHQKYKKDGMYVYEAKWKYLHAGIYNTSRAVIAGRRIYVFTVVLSAEEEAKGYAEKFLASIRFNPALLDTSDISQNRDAALLQDLHATDTAVFNIAAAAFSGMNVDTANRLQVMKSLEQPFPLDTASTPHTVKMQLLHSLEDFPDDDLIRTALQLYHNSNNRLEKAAILWYLSNLDAEAAFHAFLRLAGEVRREDAATLGRFGYRIKQNAYYTACLPEMVTMAAGSDNFLSFFAAHSRWDSIWRAPLFQQYGLAKLGPGLQRLFDEAWKERKNPANTSYGLRLPERIRIYGYLLGQPAFAGNNLARLQTMLKDTTPEIRNLGATGLINAKVKLPDDQLRLLIQDPLAGYSFITTLKDNGQMAVIRKLLSAEILSRATAYDHLGEDAGTMPLILVKKIRTIIDKQARLFFVFRYTDEDKQVHYLVTGPQPVAAGTFDLNSSFAEELEAADMKMADEKLAGIISKAYKTFLEGNGEGE